MGPFVFIFFVTVRVGRLEIVFCPIVYVENQFVKCNSTKDNNLIFLNKSFCVVLCVKNGDNFVYHPQKVQYHIYLPNKNHHNRFTIL